MHRRRPEAALMQVEEARARLHLGLEPGEGVLLHHVGEPVDQPAGRGQGAAGQPVAPEGDQGGQHLRPPEPGGERLGPPVVGLDHGGGVAVHRADAQPAQHPGDELVEVAVGRLGQVLQELQGTREQLRGLGVRSARVLGAGGDEIEARGALGGSGEIEVLGDEGGLGAAEGEGLRHAVVRLPAHVEDLGLVGGVAHQGVAESVGAHHGAGRLDDPLVGQEFELFGHGVLVADHRGDDRGVEGRPHGCGDLDHAQVDPGGLEPPGEQLLEP
jgi:hypothetical protein